MLAKGILPTGYLDLAEGKLFLTEMGYHAPQSVPREEPVREETPQQAAAREDDILREAIMPTPAPRKGRHILIGISISATPSTMPMMLRTKVERPKMAAKILPPTMNPVPPPSFLAKLCKDLRRMLAKGILPTGYLDLAEGKLFLTESRTSEAAPPCWGAPSGSAGSSR
mgnify:CR=1 FL=1